MDSIGVPKLCSRDIVSYTISEHPVLSMVTTMLEQAFTAIPDGTGLILHSDQGWQYQHKRYQRMLKQKGIINLYACVAYSENEDEFISHDSVIFHELMGFKTVGKCNKCGYKFNKWYDILYMEKFIGSHK